MSIISELASGSVGGFFGGLGSAIKDIRTAITNEIPAEKRAELETKLLELENQAAAAQTNINLEEAKSERLFVSGWRPFCGWVGGFALAYAAIFEPFMSWTAQVAFGYVGTFPKIDTTITMQVLFGLLGLGAFRSYDKKQAPSPAGKE